MQHHGHAHGSAAHGPGGHAHGSGANQRRLAIALGLAATYMVAEVVGGLLTGSLALLADAGHMLSDVFALSLSLVAMRIARRSPTPRQTYGFHRSEILAALAHGVLLVLVSLYIFVEAAERVREPHAILGGPMMAVAAGGLAINLAGLAILRHGRKENLNMRGAWLHVLSDALGSAGALCAGALVWLFGWVWADAAASILIASLIIYSSWALLREAVAILMEWAPSHIDVEGVRAALEAHPGVSGVHDLHVWTIASGMVSLSGHVVSDEGPGQGDLLQQLCELLHDRFSIRHATLQIEPKDFQEPGDVCPS